MPIQFYRPRGPYEFFSNFSRDVVSVYGRKWLTSEHPFQAMKFWPHRMDLVSLVQHSATPTHAAALGRDRAHPRRQDWDTPPSQETLLERIPDAAHAVFAPDDQIGRPQVEAEPLFARTKDVFMYEICWAKFVDTPLQSKLLATGDEVLIEDSPYDPYWGWGASRIGENKLGRILMAIRDALNAGVGAPTQIPVPLEAQRIH